MCPKCKCERRVKYGFHRGKQRYLCKSCGCNYVENPYRGYSESKKQEAIRYYLEGIGLRRIERLLGMSHVSVMNWIKKAAAKVKKIIKNENEKEPRKAEVLELDEMCISFKKKFGCGLQLNENQKD
jgi:transposase-like protein